MKRGVPSLTEHEASRALRDWYGRPLGQLVAADEQAELDRLLPDLFGYHLIQVGFATHSLFSASRILHRAVMCVGPPAGDDQAMFSGEPGALPITSYTLDALILHHTLEFSPDPRQVLREAERTLVPEGHLVVLGFNPRGLWGLRRLFRRRRGRVPWDGRFLSAARVKDWLKVLGFEIVACHPIVFRPPAERQGLLQRLQFKERGAHRGWPLLGGAYVLLARKKVMAMTPIKPRWRPRRARVGLVDPAARRCEHDGAG
ncbi:MAG: methyltransferase domain-containing protein [Gammaproteobacteria bacterium]